MEVQSLPVVDSVGNYMSGRLNDAHDCGMANSSLSAQLNDADGTELKSASATGRRFSARLLKKEKPFYGDRKASDSTASRVAKDQSSAEPRDVPNPLTLHDGEETEGKSPERSPARMLVKEKKLPGYENGIVNLSESIGKKRARGDLKECDPIDLMDMKDESTAEEAKAKAAGSNVSILKSDHAKVKDTLRIFNEYYLHFVQEEEKRCKKNDLDESMNSRSPKCKAKKGCKANNKNAKDLDSKGHGADDSKRSSKRPDLKAISKMMDTGSILYPGKRVGNLPGIHVGRQFFSRAEMVALGFHSHWLNGIDFMGQAYSRQEEYKHYNFPLAVSIVMSGMYEDDLDNSEDVVYTGQGGNNLLGDKRQCRDQVMLRGNLALKNNMEQSVPVRVIRGHESVNSYCGRVYTYDGLYKVISYWAEKGVSGFTVFKYRLRRLEGQPILTTNQVHFSRSQPPKSLSELRGLVCEDISEGQEKIPIPATNVVDDPPLPPSGYVYSKNVQVSGIKLPVTAAGCSCKGTCTDPRACSCARLNGCDFPYVRRDGGRLVTAKDVVFECGPNCGCGPDCINRVSQKNIRYRLEVFRTSKKGWAVRSWDSIPSGAAVCEYTGVIRGTDDLDNVAENNFIFDIDCLQTIKGLDGRERRMGGVSLHSMALGKTEEKKLDNGPDFCIDAGLVGNVARFINHSCEPNLFVQCVLSSHHDIKLARIVLFAADNIPPLQELTYDYGYALDSVVAPDGSIRRMACYCGAAGCRKRLH